MKKELVMLVLGFRKWVYCCENDLVGTFISVSIYFFFPFSPLHLPFSFVGSSSFISSCHDHLRVPIYLVRPSLPFILLNGYFCWKRRVFYCMKSFNNSDLITCSANLIIISKCFNSWGLWDMDESPHFHWSIVRFKLFWQFF